MMIPPDALFATAGAGRAPDEGTAGAEFLAMLAALLGPDDGGEAAASLTTASSQSSSEGARRDGPGVAADPVAALFAGQRPWLPDGGRHAAAEPADLEDLDGFEEALTLLADPDVDERIRELLADIDPEELEAALADDTLPDASLPGALEGAPDDVLDGTLAAPAPSAEVLEQAGVSGRPDRSEAAPPARDPQPARGRPEPETVRPASTTTATPEPAATEPVRPAQGARPATLPAAVERVLEVVAELEHAPPPRRFTLELGEGRVRVALEDGAVRLSVLEGDRETQRLLDEAATALAERGFDLARDGRQPPDEHASDDPPTDDPGPWSPHRGRAADGLRL